MIPVNDNVPRRYTPWVNYALISANVLVFLFELGLGPGVDAFIQRWGVTPVVVSQVLAGDARLQPAALWTLITALFLHGGWLHLGGNMLFLWVFGDNVEDRFGHVRYLLFYLICGVGANLAQVYSMPSSHVPLIGASGAIAAVLGAYLVMYPRARVTVLIPVFFFPLLVPIPAFLMLVTWFVVQFANGLATITQQAQMSGGVGWWAHVGGFVLGAAFTPLIPKARTREAVYRPLTVQSPRAMRRSSPAGAMAVRAVTLAGEAINILLTLRIIFMAVAASTEGPLGFLVTLTYALSWPLVEPFTAFVPYLSLNGHIIELYSILAFLVYYALVAVLAWVLGLLFLRRRPTDT